MFGFCQYSGGLYYNEPNDTKDAAELKAVAAQAKGDSSHGHLMTFENFFSQNQDLFLGKDG